MEPHPASYQATQPSSLAIKSTLLRKESAILMVLANERNERREDSCYKEVYTGLRSKENSGLGFSSSAELFSSSAELFSSAAESCKVVRALLEINITRSEKD